MSLYYTAPSTYDLRATIITCYKPPECTSMLGVSKFSLLTFWTWHKWSQLHFIIWFTHLYQNFLEGMELALRIIYIVLIYLSTDRRTMWIVVYWYYVTQLPQNIYTQQDKVWRAENRHICVCFWHTIHRNVWISLTKMCVSVFRHGCLQVN
jgi:hypothetical protein